MIDSIGRRLAGEWAVVSGNSASFLWIVVCTLDSACCQLSMGRYISLLVLSLILATTAVPADAQGRGRGVSRFGAPTPPVPGSAAARVNQEPAYARGYSDGYRHAQQDRSDRRGYDPVAHRDYRDADQGFYRSYGSHEAYKDNYRAGFRAGYDAGYRDPSGRGR